MSGYTKADRPKLEAAKAPLLYGFLSYPDNHSGDTYPERATHEENDQRMVEQSSKLTEAIEHYLPIEKKKQLPAPGSQNLNIK